MIIIYSSISDIFHSFFQFCPVSSSFVRTKLEEIGFFHFFPGVPEEIGFFRKKPNPELGPINNIPAVAEITAWLRSGDKPLSESMML